MTAIWNFILSLFRWWFTGKLKEDEIRVEVKPVEPIVKVFESDASAERETDEMKNSTLLIGIGGLAAVAGLAISTSNSEKKTLPKTPPVPGKLEPGDHVWFWNGNVTNAIDIPQQAWFGTTKPGDFANHGSEIFYYVIYDNDIRKGQPHLRGKTGSFAWMHNNPGNIMGPQSNLGQYPNKFGWHHFMIFPTFQLGFDAIAKYLRTNARYVGKTIKEAFNIYAPKSDGGNDPDRYAAEVASAAGVSVNTLMSSLSDEQMRLVQDKITSVEGLIPGEILNFASSKLPNEIKSLLNVPIV